MSPAGANRREPVRAADGRRTRWTEHRRARRAQLVASAVDAARRVGPDLAVDDVARSAGVSKTVVYRYFADRDHLVDAVLQHVAQRILLPRLLGELHGGHPDHRAALHAVIAAFVAVVEGEPQLYRFACAQAGRAGRAGLVADIEREMAGALGGYLSARLAAAGRPTEAAMTWAYGVVGMVQLATHWWTTTRRLAADELVDQLVELADGGLARLLRAGHPGNAR